MGSALDKIKAKYGGQAEQSIAPASAAPTAEREPIDASSNYDGTKVLTDLFNPMVNTGDKALAATAGAIGRPFSGPPTILDLLGMGLDTAPNRFLSGLEEKEPVYGGIGQAISVVAPIAAEKAASGLGIPLLKLILGEERSKTIGNAFKSLSPAFKAEQKNAAVAEYNAPYNEIVAEEGRLAGRAEKALASKMETDFNAANKTADKDLLDWRRTKAAEGKIALKEQAAGEKSYAASKKAEAKSLEEQAQMQQQADLAAEQKSAERGKAVDQEAIARAPVESKRLGDESRQLKDDVTKILKESKDRVRFDDLLSDSEVAPTLSKMERSGQLAKVKNLKKEFRQIVGKVGNAMSMVDADEQKQLFANRAYNERGKMDTDAADFYDSLRRAIVKRIRTGLPPEQGAKVEQLDNIITEKIKTKKSLVPSVKKAKKAQSETDALETIFPWMKQPK